MGYIYEKSVSAARCIENLYKYSRLNSSIYELEKQNLDFAVFMRSFIIGFYFEFEKGSFLLDIQIPEKSIPFYFDKTELERAISNIIGNTLKYNTGGTKFSAELKENSKNITLILEDNGIGIPEEIKKNSIS